MIDSIDWQKRRIDWAAVYAAARAEVTQSTAAELRRIAAEVDAAGITVDGAYLRREAENIERG